MALAKMTASDRRIIFECLIAAARGPFFCDSDLTILFCLDRHEMLEIVARIPQIEDTDPEMRRLIGHVLLCLLGYPHGKSDQWNNWISASRDDVENVAARWQALQPPIVYERFEVFGPAFVGGRYYRVVVYQVRGGGHGYACQVWNGQTWLYPHDGPGYREVMATAPVSAEELRQNEVDCSPLPSDYDPLTVEGEGPALGVGP